MTENCCGEKELKAMEAILTKSKIWLIDGEKMTEIRMRGVIPHTGDYEFESTGNVITTNHYAKKHNIGIFFIVERVL